MGHEGGVTLETGVRLVAFLAVFLLIAGLERLRPRRRLTLTRARRWVTNLSIIAIDNLVVRLMAAATVPLVAVAAAVWAGDAGVGLFNWLGWPEVVEGLIAVVALDFALWLQHVASHKVPVLWRLHQMHHADPDFDITTGIRFHPIEIALSMLWKVVWVLALGASVTAVIVFEIVLNAGAMFSHANLALPDWLDRGLRRLIVTPDMHRVHHSVLRREHDANYGFNLSIWDRLFLTYRDQPEGGHEGMTVGLSGFKPDEAARVGWSLAMPFRRSKPS